MAQGIYEMKRTSKGFTLIELVVAMVVAAILVSIAIPAYSSYVRKAHRTDAKAALLDLISLEERYFSTASVYSSTGSDLGYTAFPVTIGTAPGDFTISAPQIVAAVVPTAGTTGTPAKVTITAVAINDQANDTACASFVVDSSGLRQAFTQGAVDNSATCWN
jgi:type IV pilus assembly protein PilE